MSITDQSISANQKNSNLSTGPKNTDRVRGNALKHGILSRKLFLEDEDSTEFYALVDELIGDLQPAGRMETFLVERLAMTIWRELRLFRAEAAQIELELRVGSASMRKEAGKVVTKRSGQIGYEDFQPLSESEAVRLLAAEAFLKEYQQNETRLAQHLVEDLSNLEQTMPSIYEELSLRAEHYGLSIADYLIKGHYTVERWAGEAAKQAEDVIRKLLPRQQLSNMLDLFRAALSTSERHSVISKYQTTLDNELYKALKAFREAQEWRLEMEHLRGKIIDATIEETPDAQPNQ